MKNIKTLLSVAFIAITIIFTSCGNDDDAPTPILTTNQINVQDLIVAIDENPTNGQIVDTVEATQTVGGGTISFSINSQTPAGALNIDPSTGELTVADATLFDFETNPVITATVEVVGAVNTGIVTINLNNINELSIQNFDTTFDENPTNGQSIGTVQATGDGNLSFSISSQTPVGALNINASTGELTVADAALFDYETNVVITADISVDNSVSTVAATASIDLNNINELGDFNHGGVVFWIDPTDDTHGLVCALDNQMTAAWGCSGVVTGATGTVIGTGETNTATIVSAGCATGGAAEIVSNLNLNGYNDWFLPSVDEMNEISTNYQTYISPTIQANGGSALFGTVWTSTESNNVNAFIAYLSGSNPTPITKTLNVFNILPVRSF